MIRSHFRLRYLFFLPVLTWAIHAPDALTGHLELTRAAQIGVVYTGIMLNAGWATGRDPWAMWRWLYRRVRSDS